jgi:uncharacterized membrane protein YidH (DUF202 family)
MTRLQVIYLQLCVVLTAATGIVFAWMKYGMKTTDPFSVVNHPMQPFMLAAHVVVAPLLVFAFGWIFNDHIWAKFRSPGAPQRGTGIWSMAAIVPMILSGYLLQVSTAEATRQAMAAAHWVSSGLFVLAYGVHVITKPKPSS